ncbi:hypothetical protein MW887_005579 [Aspergillus wentii]|nr:hypothetical protein MW887_005579 [Aspergillus wentii]
MPRRSMPKVRSGCITCKIPGSQADRQRLHFYCCQAAESLASYSDSTLWTSLILQRSHHYPVVRNALVTLSTLYQDHLLDASPSTPSPQHIHLIAKCHRQLSVHLTSPDASIEVALICSLIFYVLEALVANTHQAIWHLDQGLILLQRCRADLPRLTSDGIFTSLVDVFSRLDIQASTFDDSRVPRLSLVPSVERSGIVPVVPEVFINSSHAEAILTRLQNWMMHHLIAHVDNKHRSLEDLPQDLLHERLILEEQFEQFIATLNDLFERDSDATKHLYILRIQALVFHSVLLENIPLPNIFPPATTVHKPTLNTNMHATLEDISTLLSSNSDTTSGRNFTLSTQLISALFFVCLKTTSQDILKTALSLLQHSQLPSRDGLWDAGLAALVINTILERQDDAVDEVIEQRVEDIGLDILDPVEGGLNEVFRSLCIRQAS